MAQANEAPFENYGYKVEEIDGIINFADKGRQRDDPIVYGIGSAPTDRGGGSDKPPLLSLAASGYLDAQWQGKVISACRLNDPVCAHELSRTLQYNDLHLRRTTDGRKDAGWLWTAAAWMKSLSH